MDRWLGVRRAVTLAVGLLALVACRESRVEEPAPVHAPLGDAAAMVNGEAISLEEVRRLCASTGSDARTVLRQLVDERLLAQHAVARGYEEQRAVRIGVAQARVRAVLAQEIEGPGSPTEVEARRHKLAQWLAVLRQKTPVRYDEAAIQKAFVQATP